MTDSKRKPIRKNISVARGDNFAAAGMGKDGSYITGVRRLEKRTYVKGSVGSRGAEVAVKRTGKKGSVEARVNLTKKRASIKVKPRSKPKRPLKRFRSKAVRSLKRLLR
ncbi:MAG: hypothetical protein ACFFER_17715 [Candidatus Thorarchaeota archaeon]